MEDVRRRRQITTYARELVKLLGFTGDDAEREHRYLFETLDANEAVDYDALQRRADKYVREKELRPVLREHGLSDGDIDRLLADFPGSEG